MHAKPPLLDRAGEPDNGPYSRVVEDMKGLYGNKISTKEAHDAARNLIGFSRTILAIERRLAQDPPHAKIQ